MKIIKCVNCDRNLIEEGLLGYRDSIYLTEYNQENNRFENLSVSFNPFTGWRCNCCEELIDDDMTFDALQEYLPNDEDLNNLDLNLILQGGYAYTDRECHRCKESYYNTGNTDITKEGIEFIAETVLKFNSNSNKFEVNAIENPMNYIPTSCCCGTKLIRDLDKNKFNNPIEIPFF